MRPDLIEQDLITSADIRNSSKMFTQHLRKHKSEASAPFSLMIKKENPEKTCADRSTFSCLAVTGGVAVPGIFQGITAITQCYSSLLWRTLHSAEVTLFKLWLLHHTQIAKHWTKLSKHLIINFTLIK